MDFTALTVSAGLVALAEIGDKTQLLALLLVARFRQPWPILAGILAATIVNHALAAWFGAAAGALLPPWALAFGLGLGFLAMAVWILIPDQDEGLTAPTGAGGVFWATTVAFFLAEMGDKTQFATIGLAARYQDVAAVAAGTTLGMLLANAPAVFLGDAIVRRAPMRLVRLAAAAVCTGLGALSLIAAAAAMR